VGHTAVYTLGANGFTKTEQRDREKPSAEQLERLLGAKPTKELLLQYVRE
jgi:hypothetical protein